MERLSLSIQEILAATPGSRLLNADLSNAHAGPVPERAETYSEAVFDSRACSPDCVFFCIKGARVDAHDLIDHAIANGARLVVGDDAGKLTRAADRHPGHQFLVASDSLTALQKLATLYRRKFAIPVIGLTGSSGKTTTKDLVASIFGDPRGPALITEGTLNNHWGVPQMVMRLRLPHRAACFEMGTSGFGEIQALSAICQPGIGFITNVGASHLEKLGDEEGVLKAKRELFDWIVERGATRTLVFNLDDPRLEKLHEEFLARKESNLRLVTLTQRRAYADVRLVSRKPLGIEHRFGWEYEIESPWGAIRGRLPLPGAHNLANAVSAATLALLTGATPGDVAEGLDHPKMSKLRSDLFRAPGGALIYDDSYNANPTSVAALFEAARAIRTTAQAGLSRTIAVVGDMLELGASSSELHESMGRQAACEGVDVLFATGRFAAAWVEGYRKEKGSARLGTAFELGSHDAVLEALLDELRRRPSETLVLIKGSRGAQMERVVEGLKRPTS